MIRNYKGKTPRIHPSAFISEAAYIVGDVEIGENCSIWPGAVIRGDFGRVRIGRNRSLEDNCVVHTADEIIIGDNVVIAHNAVVHCKRIGDNCLIGISAVLLEDAEIGESCMIAGGTLVLPRMNIPARSLVMGSPAKIKEKLSDEKLIVLKLGVEAYVELGQEYKRHGYE
jgi:carbonic anhydrase/acetyltransferase-like protein (isoleucine patch superfamily)